MTAKLGGSLGDVSGATVGVDTGGVIVFASAQAEALFGYERDQLLGESVGILVPERFRDGHVGHYAEYFAEPRVRRMGEAALDLRAVKKNGTEFPVDIALSNVETDDGIVAIASVREIPDLAGTQVKTSAGLRRMSSRAVAGAGAVALVLGALGLLGSAFGVDILGLLVSGRVTMRANTAVGLILLGGALFWRMPRGPTAGDRRGEWRRSASAAMAVAAALIGAISLSEWVFGWSSGIDDLLLFKEGAAQTLDPRPTPAAAASLVALGAALLVGRDGQGGVRVATALSMAVGAVAAIALLGQAYAVEGLYGVAKNQMAPEVAVATLALAFGVLASDPRSGLVQLVSSSQPGGVVARRLLLAMLLVGPVVGELVHKGQQAGYFETQFAFTLLLVSLMFVAGALTLSTASSLNRAALRERETHGRMEAILDNAPAVVYVVDAQGRFVLINKEFESRFHLRREDLLGERREYFLPPDVSREHVNSDLEILANGKQRVFEETAPQDDGEHTYLSLKFPLFDREGEVQAVCGISTDVTERKRQEEMVAALARDNELILTSAGDGIVRIDEDRSIVYANPACERLLGWPVEELLGQDFCRLLLHSYPDGRPYPADCCPILEVMVDGQVRRSDEEVFWRRDGSSFPVDCTSAPVRVGQEIVGAVCVFADISVQKASEHEERERILWEERISSAVASDRLVVFAQPIIDLHSGEAVSQELLVRARGTGGSEDLIAPGEFLPQAEHFGLIGLIDRWMFDQALAIAGAGDVVQVNLSAASLNDPEIRRQLLAALGHSGDAAERVTVEITESAAVENIDTAREFAEQLAELGCRLALDDFGTGFAGLAYLRELPIWFLKIDVQFVKGMLNSEADRRLVRSVIATAKELGKQTIAEGVEDEETLKLLREMGADYAQGFHLGRPGPIESPVGAPVGAP